MAKTLLIMAAGMGSRYGGLKQVEGFGPNGETLLEYGIADARKAGFDRFVFVIRRDIEEAFRSTVLARFGSSIDYSLVYQELDKLPRRVDGIDRKKPWGTGHAVWCARDAITTPFAVMNADDYYGPGAFALLAGHLDSVAPDSSAYAMVAYRLDQTLSPGGSVSRGICGVSSDGMLESVEEYSGLVADGWHVVGRDSAGTVHQLSGATPVSMNLWGLLPSVFTLLEDGLKAFLDNPGNYTSGEFYLPAAIDGGIATGSCSVKVLLTAEKWHGVTYPDDRDAVRDALRALGR